MSYYNRNRNVELNGLQLMGYNHWESLGDDFWNTRGASNEHRRYGWNRKRYYASKAMERLEKDLNKQGKEKKDVQIIASSQRKVSQPKTWYHADLLPRWDAFAVAQSSNHSLECFELLRVELPPAPFFTQKLLPILNNNSKSLMRLQLRGFDLDSSDVGKIARFVKKSKQLDTLDLSVALDSLRDTRTLSNAIKSHSKLKFVNLSKCGLGKDMKILKAVLAGLRNVKSLLLEENEIGKGDNGEEGLSLVADFIKSNDEVIILSLANNDIDHKKKSEVIAKAMRKNSTIQEMCLGDQKLDIRPFLASRKFSESLSHLDLGRCNLRTAGSRLVASFIKKNPPLSSLNLEKNGIPTPTAANWGEALLVNDNLEHLNLHGNSFNDKSIDTWKEILKSNRTLLTLNLSGNNIKAKPKRYQRSANGWGWERITNPVHVRKDFILDSMCDSTSIKSILESNHTCQLFIANNNNGVYETNELAMRKINKLDNEGLKIRHKVVLSMFKLNKELFDSRMFNDIPLELMPRVLELVQQSVGYDGTLTLFPEKRRYYSSNKNGPLGRLHQVFTGWDNFPLLVARGAGKLPPPPKEKKKRRIKTEEELDEDFQPSYAAKRPSNTSRSGGRKRRTATSFSYADVENSDDEESGDSWLA